MVKRSRNISNDHLIVETMTSEISKVSHLSRPLIGTGQLGFVVSGI